MISSMSSFDHFVKNARKHYQFEVPMRFCNADDFQDVMDEVFLLFGRDGMPYSGSTPVGRWTRTPHAPTLIFFFENDRDAVEFKLRFG